MLRGRAVGAKRQTTVYTLSTWPGDTAGGASLPPGETTTFNASCYSAGGTTPVLLSTGFMLEPHLGGRPANNITFAPNLTISADNRSFSMPIHQRLWGSGRSGTDAPGGVQLSPICISRPAS